MWVPLELRSHKIGLLIVTVLYESSDFITIVLYRVYRGNYRNKGE